MNRVISNIFLVLILGTMCFLSWYRLTDEHDWGGDFSVYIMQSQSILQGRPSEFIQTNRYAMEKSSRNIGPIAYPWGYPMLLAPFYKIFGLKMLALKSLNVICYLIFVITLWLGFSRYHSSFWRLILVCLFAFNPELLRFLNIIISDIPFLLFSTLSVLLIGRVVIQKQRFISKISDQLLIGVLIAISFFIRSQGLLILAVLGGTQFIGLINNVIAQQKGTAEQTIKQKNILLRSFSKSLTNSWSFILPYVCFAIVTILWWTVLPEGGGGHFSSVKTNIVSSIVSSGGSSGLIKHHLYYYFSAAELFFKGLRSNVRLTLFGASLPVFIIGMFKRRHLDYHFIIYGVLTMLLLISFPGARGRYLFPLLPIYVSFVLTGMETFHDSDRILNVFWRAISIFSAIVIIVFFLRISINNVSENLAHQRKEKTGPYLSTSKELFSFISNNTRNDSIIMFFKPRVMRLYTNRQSILIDQVGKLGRGDYLCFYLRAPYHQIREDDVISLLENDKIRLVYQNVDFQLYRIIKPFTKDHQRELS